MPNLDNRRIRNQLLTNLAMGFKLANMIADKILPFLMTNKEKIDYIKFDKTFNMAYNEAFMAVGMGAEPHFIDFDTAKASATLYEYAIGTKIYRREMEEADNLIKLQSNKTKLVVNAMDLFREKMIATMLQLQSNYTNKNILDNTGPGKYKWSHANADPIANIATAVDAIRTSVSMLADTIVFGYASARVLTKVVSVQRLVLGANLAGLSSVTPIAACNKIAENFGIKNVLIGEAQYSTSPTSSFSDLWSDNVIVAYVGKSELSSDSTQNFACTFRKKGRPEIQKETIPLTDNTQAIINRDLFEPVFLNEKAGYLIQDTV